MMVANKDSVNKRAAVPTAATTQCEDFHKILQLSHVGTQEQALNDCDHSIVS